MKKYIYALLIALGAASLAAVDYQSGESLSLTAEASQDSLEEVRFFDQLNYRGTYDYKLLGIYKLFDISLYATSDCDPIENLGKCSMSLVFRYNRGFTASQLTKAGDRALKVEATSLDREYYADSLAALNRAYQDVRKGDTYRLDYEPESGLSLYLNGSKLATIRDEGFARFYFSIWLGQREDCLPIKEKFAI
ncbi:MAG: chalcone isomerase family protein [Verrucomicrobiota bacterium]